MQLPIFAGKPSDEEIDAAKDFMRGRMMEEVATVQLNYAEICQLLESGTVKPGSPIEKKLRAARDAFRKTPKVYGKGLKLARSSDEMLG